MDPQFFKGTTKGMRIGFLGFCVAAAGGLVAVFGSWTQVLVLAVGGFILVVIGVGIGFIGVGYHWLMVLLEKPTGKI